MYTSPPLHNQPARPTARLPLYVIPGLIDGSRLNPSWVEATLGDIEPATQGTLQGR
jgi:hypothetical protein